MDRSSTIKLQRILKIHTTNIQSMGSAEEQNKQVVRQYIEAFNRQDIERLGQLVLSTNHSFQFSGMHPLWIGIEPSNSTLPSGVHFQILVLKSKRWSQKEIKSQSVSLILALTKESSRVYRRPARMYLSVEGFF